MIREFLFGQQREVVPRMDSLSVGTQILSLLIVRNPRARRYSLRLRDDGTARVTVPRGGSLAAAREFAERNAGWLATQLERLKSQPREIKSWQVGTEIMFRGEQVIVEAGRTGTVGMIRLGSEEIRVTDATKDLRPAIERHLRKMAAGELPPLVLELASRHRVTVNRVTVRGQKTRWGSCSRRGTVSLNWKLIQTPPFVRDYIVLHELMHLRQMNHSGKFWREVESVCPDFRTAERWLKITRSCCVERLIKKKKPAPLQPAGSFQEQSG